MKVILFERSDGSITIRVPNDHDIEQALMPGRIKNVVSARVIESSEVPADRTFRNAWKADLTVDMPKAREIHRERLRQMRAPLLVALDAEYLRADETGNIALKTEIAAKKQILRNITDDPLIGAAKTPEELKAAIPLPLQ